MIKFTNFTYTVKDRKKPILKDINIEIGNNEFVTVFGPSGSGKTTLCELMLGIKKRDGIINDFSAIAFIEQERTIFNDLNIYDNIVLGTKRKKNSVEKVNSILKDLKLDSFSLKDKVNTLSGGQKQRLAIARAIFLEADLLIADEPFIGLDIKVRDEIVSLIKRTFKYKTVILITHDQELEKTFGNRTLEISDGVIKKTSN